MTRRIAVFSGSRADYGLLKRLMRLIADDPELELLTIAAGMHLAPEFGLTWREIAADGFAIDARVEMLLASDTRLGVAKSLGLGTMGIADALDRLQPDLLVILGDRFEALAAAQAALILGVPIAHIHGGEITTGAYDDAVRHAITKMAALHFVAADPYRTRVIQMGTPPGAVFTVGAPGLDALSDSQMPLAQVSAELGFALARPYFLATYHPATNADEPPVAGVRALLDALSSQLNHALVLTYPNADHGGRAVIAEIDVFAAAHPARVLAVPSLGARYGAVMAGAAAVVGNSSSGIIEAPSFRVPTVDIGARQAGRLAAASVRHVAADRVSIAAGIAWAVSAAGADAARTAVNPYGSGNAAPQMHALIKSERPDTSLPFHDLPGENP